MASRPANYRQIMAVLIQRIRKMQLHTMSVLNKELLGVYWHIGMSIQELQKKEGWGSKVIDRMVADLSKELPDFKGLSARNLKYMRAFAFNWPEFGSPERKSVKNSYQSKSSIVQAELAQLPWYYHITILDKVRDRDHRIFYIRQTIENGWNRKELLRQISSGLHKRIGKSISNFKLTLPPSHSDLAQQALRNPYVFDILGLSEKMKERELEDGLIKHLKEFMLELGKGFSWVGKQYKLEVDGDEYYLDLLFYNWKLHCFVVIELKVSDFQPEFIGKLNFYINTVNQQLRKSEDNPTIGILLCKTTNDTVVRYSLEGVDAPIGVSNYQFKTAVPKEIQSELPTVEELKKVLEKKTRAIRKPGKKK